jgi:hypothetical protein
LSLRGADVRPLRLGRPFVERVGVARVAGGDQALPVLRGDRDIRARIEDLAHEPEDLDAEGFAEQALRDRARRDAARGLAGARALERLAAVGREPLDRPGQVRVPRAGAVHRGRALEVVEAAVAVGDLDDERGADGLAEADAAEELDVSVSSFWRPPRPYPPWRRRSSPLIRSRSRGARRGAR